jgi:hypothetical protein
LMKLAWFRSYLSIIHEYTTKNWINLRPSKHWHDLTWRVLDNMHG